MAGGAMIRSHAFVLLLLLHFHPAHAQDELVIYGDVIHPISGPPIENGAILIRNGHIAEIGPAASVQVPVGTPSRKATVVIPGLIDIHSVVGLAGYLNQEEDSDQADPTQPIQPQLRAIDAYNCRDELVAWLRQFGVTTLHTGHAPTQLVSGQTMIVKTVGDTVEEAVRIPARAVAVTLTSTARRTGKESPGTRGKAIAMLREELLAASQYRQVREQNKASQADKPRDLKLEVWSEVLDRRLALMITAEKAQDIEAALRLAQEFDFELWLDGASEAYLLIDEIRQARVPVLMHATMARPVGEREQLSFETAARLVDAEIPVAIQSGYEAYVPKTRVVLFEAALAAANGLGRERALRAITLEPARILGIDQEVGSLEPGKRADLALYDGDPFEYTTHCIAVIIDGKVVSESVR